MKKWTCAVEESEGSNKNTVIEQYETEENGDNAIESVIASGSRIGIIFNFSRFVSTITLFVWIVYSLNVL